MASLVIVGAILTAARIPLSSETLRTRVIATLEDRFDAKVELAELTLRFYPSIRIVGTGLEIRHRGRVDVPPLIAVQQFTVHTDFMTLWRRHVARVELDGLKVHIPPGGMKLDPPSAESDPTEVQTDTPSEQPEDDSSYIRQVVLDRLDATNAEVVILRRDPNKPVRTWYSTSCTCSRSA